jgi:hypothetical protein
VLAGSTAHAVLLPLTFDGSSGGTDAATALTTVTYTLGPGDSYRLNSLAFNISELRSNFNRESNRLAPLPRSTGNLPQ